MGMAPRKSAVVAAFAAFAVFGCSAAGASSATEPAASQPAASESPAPEPPAPSGLPHSSACEPVRAHHVGAFYPGPAASDRYESIFRRGFAVPHLDTHVPQGITTWSKWKSGGGTIVLISMYRKGANSYLVGIDPESGEHVGTVEVSEGHIGGIAVVGQWLFAQDDDRTDAREQVRKYRLSSLSAKLQEAQRRKARPYLGRSGGLQTVHGASFVQSYGGELWAGRYDDFEPDEMYRYRVSSSGKLTSTGSSYEVPARTQGVVVTSDRLIFNISNHSQHGLIWTMPRRHKLAGSPGRCFVAPSMGENMVRLGDRVVSLYEGGSYKYKSGSTNYLPATNPIEHLHVGSLDSLRALS